MRRGLTIQQHEDKVVLILDGKYVCDMPWNIAEEAGRLMIGIARKAEEYAKANSIIAQEALLIRSGAPFGLSTDPKIRDAAYQAAQWDSAARKGMPLRVPSPSQVYAPSLMKSPKVIQ